jgi:nucleoside-diphosphate-sugar epimerase
LRWGFKSICSSTFRSDGRLVGMENTSTSQSTSLPDFSGKTLLVTGATGFLGRALVERLSQESDAQEIRVLVRNPLRSEPIKDLPRVTIADGDLTLPDTLPDAVRGIQIVFHSGAALGGDLALQMAVNRDGTRHLAIAAANAAVERFVHISTVSVYGYRNRQDVTEETRPDPGRDPYPISKLAAEEALKDVAASHRLAYTIIRPGMIYGPHSSMWTGQMFKVARRRPTLFVGSGSGSTYPIHIDDLLDLLLIAAVHPNAVGETFNGTPDPSPTWREYLGSFARLAGHQSWLGVPPLLLWPLVQLIGRLSPRSSPMVDLPELLPFSQRYITYSTEKARCLLGWTPKVTLQQGIDGTADWLRERGLLK